MRLAPPVERSDWCQEVGLDARQLSEAERSELTAHWQEMGLMEHASVAAFARFTLQLLQLGAPSELIDAAQQALIDETRHARQAFALASAYAGRAIGPGPLATGDALADDSLETLLFNTVLEGCIGETVAAMEARVASERCSDPVVRGILAGIAEDEARAREFENASVGVDGAASPCLCCPRAR
jgi:hypothetical protein